MAKPLNKKSSIYLLLALLGVGALALSGKKKEPLQLGSGTRAKDPCPPCPVCDAPPVLK